MPALSDSTREAVDLMFDKAREAGLFISFDPNLRPQLWPSQDVMVQTLNRLDVYKRQFQPFSYILVL